MTDAPDHFEYDELWYVRGIGDGNKNPKDKWGGYSDDDGSPRDFDAAPKVYTHDDVLKFPSDSWLVPAIYDKPHMTRWLLVFDIDIHKAPDDFDENRVTVAPDTPLIKTQSGGYHVYTMVTNRPTRGKESDFEIVQDLPGDFDVDIRGEFVKHHVVAPRDIPGVGGEYELVNDAPIKGRNDPDELAQMIQLDGEPLVRYNPVGDRSGSSYERGEIDPPAEMPMCYGAGLDLRAKAPERDDLNTHKVNVLTALCGLAAGYDTETVVEHFVEHYPPGQACNADLEKTEYQVEHIAKKLENGTYSAPPNLTLQQYSLLPEGEWCDCEIRGHSGEPRAVNGHFGNEIYAKMETTDDMETVFDAIASVAPSDIGIDLPPGVSTHTDYGVWVLTDRNSIIDALQIVAYDAELIEEIHDYPSGEEFWKAVAQLRECGANIPRYTGADGAHPDGLGLYEEPADQEEATRQALRALHAGKRRS